MPTVLNTLTEYNALFLFPVAEALILKGICDMFIKF